MVKKGILTTLALVLALTIAVACSKSTAEVEQAASKFLNMIAQGNVSGAYQASANTYKGQVDEDTFKMIMGQMGLQNFQSVSWSSKNVVGSQAFLEGTMTTNTGRTDPLTMTMTKEGDTWLVMAVSGPEIATLMDKPVTSAAAAPADPRVPGTDKLNELANESVLAFHKAIQAKDFSSFHAYIAQAWQEQTTAADLQSTFEEFVAKQINCDVSSLKPVFDVPPQIEDDMLILIGHYPTQPTQLKFELKYLEEGGVWKLAGISMEKN